MCNTAMLILSGRNKKFNFNKHIYLRRSWFFVNIFLKTKIVHYIFYFGCERFKNILG